MGRHWMHQLTLDLGEASHEALKLAAFKDNDLLQTLCSLLVTTGDFWLKKLHLYSQPLGFFLRRCSSADPCRGLWCGGSLWHGCQSHHSAQPQPQRPPQTQQCHHEGSLTRRGPTQTSSVPHTRSRWARQAPLSHQLWPKGRHYQRR